MILHFPKIYKLLNFLIIILILLTLNFFTLHKKIGVNILKIYFEKVIIIFFKEIITRYVLKICIFTSNLIAFSSGD